MEDKRIAAERKMISLQTKYDSLEKAYQVAKQQIKKHKVVAFFSSLLIVYHDKISCLDGADVIVMPI